MSARDSISVFAGEVPEGPHAPLVTADQHAHPRHGGEVHRG